jgi:hypothetical protein
MRNGPALRLAAGGCATPQRLGQGWRGFGFPAVSRAEIKIQRPSLRQREGDLDGEFIPDRTVNQCAPPVPAARGPSP